MHHLTDLGFNKLSELKDRLKSYFEILKSRIEIEEDLDFDKLLDEANLTQWQDPIDFILSKDVSDEEKLEILLEMQTNIENNLKRIKKEIRKLKKSVNHDKEDEN